MTDRISKLKKRITRLSKIVEACKQIGPSQPLLPRRKKMLGIVDFCVDQDGDADFDELVDMVEEFLDDRIEPSNPIYEWISDVGIAIAAHAAVTVWHGRRKKLERRLIRLIARVDRLEAEKADK